MKRQTMIRSFKIMGKKYYEGHHYDECGRTACLRRLTDEECERKYGERGLTDEEWVCVVKKWYRKLEKRLERRKSYMDIYHPGNWRCGKYFRMDLRLFKSVVEVITHDGIICLAGGDDYIRREYNRVRNDMPDVEIEVYKYLDYLKLHPDFEERYWQSMRDNDIFRGE